MKVKFKIPAGVTNIINRLNAKGFEAYVVGGVLRDILLKRNPGDFDIATNAKPLDVSKIFKKTVPTGIKHGTVTVIEKGEHFEVTTFRNEWGYTDSRRPDKVKFINDLKEDLARRDFTVNALAYDVKREEIIDPFSGIRDLKKRIIKTVGDPLARFKEDALRMIRAARFASVLNFKIEAKTLKAIRTLNKRVSRLSCERIRDEIMKIMASPRPSTGIRILDKTGVLWIIFPELKPAKRFKQGGLHEFDLFEHSLRAMDNAPKEKPILRLAALLHDIGKIKTRFIEKGEYHFWGHENAGEKMIVKILKRMKFSNRDISYVSILVRNHMFNYSKSWSAGAIRRLLVRVGKENLGDLLALRVADAKACGENRRPGKEIKELAQKASRIIKEDQALKISDLAVDGNDVMKGLKIGPGKRVGDILRKILEIVLEDDKKNRRGILLKEIKKWNAPGDKK